MDCIFCSIATGDIPSVTIYEDDQVRAIFDINPVSQGHILVMPKAHYANLLECPDALIDHLFETAARIGRKAKETLQCEGVNILTNAGEAAGQSVNHVHVHVIPRWKDQPEKDAMNLSFGSIPEQDFQKLAQLLSL